MYCFSQKSIQDTQKIQTTFKKIINLRKYIVQLTQFEQIQNLKSKNVANVWQRHHEDNSAFMLRLCGSQNTFSCEISYVSEMNSLPTWFVLALQCVKLQIVKLLTSMTTQFWQNCRLHCISLWIRKSYILLYALFFHQKYLQANIIKSKKLELAFDSAACFWECVYLKKASQIKVKNDHGQPKYSSFSLKTFVSEDKVLFTSG